MLIPGSSTKWTMTREGSTEFIPSGWGTAPTVDTPKWGLVWLTTSRPSTRKGQGINGMYRGGGGLSLGWAARTTNPPFHRGGSQSGNLGSQRGRRPRAGQDSSLLLSAVLEPSLLRGDGYDREFPHWSVKHGLLEQGFLGAYPKMSGH